MDLGQRVDQYVFKLELLTKYGDYFGALRNELIVKERMSGLGILHYNYVTDIDDLPTIRVYSRTIGMY